MMDQEWHPRTGDFPPLTSSSLFLSGIKAGDFCQAVEHFSADDAFACQGVGTFFHSSLEHIAKNGDCNFDSVSRLFRKLAETGVDVDARDSNHESPLLKLIRIGHRFPSEHRLKTLLLLVSLGAKVDSTDNHGITPAMECVHFGFPDELEALLSLGANLSIRMKETKRGFPFLIPIKTSAPAGMKTKEVSRRLLKILISHGCDLKQKDYEGLSVSHMLAKKGVFESDPEIYEVFISENLDARDSYGMLAYDLAKLSKNTVWLSIWEKLYFKGKTGAGSGKRRGGL